MGNSPKWNCKINNFRIIISKRMDKKIKDSETLKKSSQLYGFS